MDERFLKYLYIFRPYSCNRNLIKLFVISATLCAVNSLKASEYSSQLILITRSGKVCVCKFLSIGSSERSTKGWRLSDRRDASCVVGCLGNVSAIFGVDRDLRRARIRIDRLSPEDITRKEWIGVSLKGLNIRRCIRKAEFMTVGFKL